MVDHIVKLLIQERDKLNRAIEALQGSAKRRGRPPGSGRKSAVASTLKNVPHVTEHVSRAAAKASAKRPMSAAGRKAIGDAARKRWAAIKAGKAPSPFANSAKAKK